MEIKDLAGLSQPMTKLIEVVEKGVGQLFKPWQIKRIADAKAYEIERVALTLEKHSDAINTLEYDGEKVKLLCEQRGVSPEAAQGLIALNERAVSRLTHREMGRQLNIEKAVHYAMDELLQVEQVSAESVDEDWIARFFNIVEDVSNEQMQQLWGRILAGEIKRPKSYSLRTLETLRNISPEEAKLFRKVGKYAIPLLDSSREFIFNDSGWLRKEIKTTDIEVLSLRDLGLLPVDQDSEVRITLFLSGELEKDYSTLSQQSIDVIYFTQTGKELLSLIDRDTDETIKILFERYSDTIRNRRTYRLMGAKLGR